MGMDVLIDCRTSIPMPTAYQEIIKKIAAEAALITGIDTGREVSVSIVDDEEIRGLNRRFRNIDNETDVLSFPSGDQNSPELGDIIISARRVHSQAAMYGHGLERELGFLTAHGMLHLFGFGHDTEEDEQEMRGLQAGIMSACGLELTGL